MRHRFWSLLAFLTSTGLAVATPVRAEDTPARAELDYRAQRGCPDAGAFTDEVAARLGFIPFDDGSARTVRVRLMRDDGTWLGTAEVDDGSPRLMRGRRCAAVARDLAAVVAVILVPEPSGERAFRETADRDSGGGDEGRRVPVRFTVSSDMELVAPTVHLQTGTAQGYGTTGTQAVYVTAQYHDRLCEMPCTARLPTQTVQLALSNGPAPPQNLPRLTRIDGASHVHIDHETRRDTRRTGWIMVAAGGGGAALLPLLLAAADTGAAPIVLSALGGLGVAVTGLVFAFTGDEFRVSVAPL